MAQFYITTPIYYINAEPHLGHAYTSMVADAIARSRRLLDQDVFFLTGTDEHGQKVERAAQKAGLDTREFADRIAAKFRELCELLNISNDDFIRTTEPRHIRAAQAIWRRVQERGYLYKAAYEGLVLHRRRAFRSRNAVAGRPPLSDLRQHGRAAQRGELLLPPLAVHRAAPRALPEASRVHHPREPPQRDDGLRRGRPQGSQRQPHLVQVGHPRARRSRARDVRVVRRAHELPDGGRLSRRPGQARPLLAGRRAPDGQGDRPAAHRLLAGVPDGRGSARAEARHRPRLVADERSQDVEVARQRGPSPGLRRAVRCRCAALLRDARDGARPGCELRRRRVPDAVQRGPGQRPGECGQPRHHDDSAVLRRRGAARRRRMRCRSSRPS